jgi:histidine triad (HIT) family protein
VFCDIVARRAPMSFVAESAEALAFLTIGPIREGHTLVIPKRHVVEFPDATSGELAAVFDLAADVARRQRQHLASQGETLFLASGVAGEQSVFHLHLHVVPRQENDEVHLSSWWQALIRKLPRERLDATARSLRGE